jgi:hypothetical protein
MLVFVIVFSDKYMDATCPKLGVGQMNMAYVQKHSRFTLVFAVLAIKVPPSGRCITATRHRQPEIVGVADARYVRKELFARARLRDSAFQNQDQRIEGLEVKGCDTSADEMLREMISAPVAERLQAVRVDMSGVYALMGCGKVSLSQGGYETPHQGGRTNSSYVNQIFLVTSNLMELNAFSIRLTYPKTSGRSSRNSKPQTLRRTVIGR